MSTDYTNVLRSAAPVGTVVTVQAVSPGRVRLTVPTGNGDDVDPITQRVATLLDLPHSNAVGEDYLATDDPAAVVALLAERLHGSPDSLTVVTA